MTGTELRERAINGAQGWLAWSKLTSREKGLWERAAMEVSHLEDQLAREKRESQMRSLRTEQPPVGGGVEVTPGVHLALSIGLEVVGGLFTPTPAGLRRRAQWRFARATLWNSRAALCADPRKQARALRRYARHYNRARYLEKLAKVLEERGPLI